MSRIFGGPVGPSSPIASGVGAGAGPAIHSHDRDADCNVATLSAALALRLGRTVVNARASAEVRAAQTRAAEVGSRFAGMSALDICHEALRLEGRPLHRGAESVVRNALSTNSLGNVFANVAHLSLEQGFDEEADSTDGWCAETDRPNFLDYTGLHVKLGDGLKLMGRGQLEPELSSLEDTGSTGQIRRYGEQFIISEQDILDDRLGVIMDAILRRGSAGKRLRVLLVYATLLSKVNDTTLFHADNGNYGTSGSALSISALRTAKAAMSKQKENGETLNLVPRYLVTGAELEFLASQLVGSAELQQVLAVVAEQVGTKNPIASWGLQHRSDARLDNGFKHPRTGATIAGSSTRWMLFAGAQAPVVEVAYRSGTNRRPRILTFNLTEGKRGWGATVDHDLGVRICGYQGAYYATGDA